MIDVSVNRHYQNRAERTPGEVAVSDYTAGSRQGLKVIIYSRVRTTDQTPKNQTHILCQ